MWMWLKRILSKSDKEKPTLGDGSFGRRFQLWLTQNPEQKTRYLDAIEKLGFRNDKRN